MPLRGETIGTAYVRVLADGSDFDSSVRRQMAQSDKEWERAGGEAGKTYSDAWLEQMRKGLTEIHAERKKEMKESDEEVINESEGRWKRFANRLGDMGSKFRGSWRLGIDDDGRGAERLARLAHAVTDVDDKFEGFSNRIGRLTGKGSRNNFLNFFGSMTRNLFSLIELLPKAAEGLGNLFGGVGGKGGGAGGIAKLATGAAASLGGLAIGLGVVVAIAAPFAALISGVAASLISLAGSAVFAAGAVGGVALALGPVLAASIGVGILALTNLDKHTKTVAKGLGSAFKDLGKDAGKSIGPGLTKAMETVKPAIKDLTPLVENVAKAIGGVALSWAKITQSKSFELFRLHMTTFLPRAIQKLGEATGNFGQGMMGVLRGLTPLMDRFLNWLVDATGKFSTWANSAKGNKAIKNFFDEAGDSAAAFGDLVGAAFDTLMTLFSEGKDEGDSTIQSLTETFEGWTAWLRDPKNQKAIDDFFANGKDTALALGGAIESIGKLIDELDTENSRQQMQDLWNAIDLVLKILEDVAFIWDNLNSSTAVLRLVVDPSSVSPERIALTLAQAFAAPIVMPLKIAFDTSSPETQGKVEHSWDLFKGWIEGKFKSLHLGALIPDISWRDIIPPISWGDLIPRPNWSHFVPKIGLNDLIPDLKWSQLIPPLRWSVFVPKISWLTLGGRINWGVLIPDVKWSDFIPDISWGDLIPDVKWSDIIPDVDWSDFVPDLNIDADINWPSPPKWLDKITAAGGVFAGAQTRIIGEAGAEAVVPLHRPLSMVDPSVRALSAFAQGIPWPGNTMGGKNMVSRTIDVGGINIHTPTQDPRAVAQEVVNRLAAVGY